MHRAYRIIFYLIVKVLVIFITLITVDSCFTLINSQDTVMATLGLAGLPVSLFIFFKIGDITTNRIKTISLEKDEDDTE